MTGRSSSPQTLPAYDGPVPSLEPARAGRSSSPATTVQDKAREDHEECSEASTPVESAWCDCWTTACSRVGPCGGCPRCTPVALKL